MSGAGPAPRAELPDLLIRGGVVVTMNDARAVDRADVLVKDGRIARIGSTAAVTRAVQESGLHTVRVIDATGCAVLPGFVQAHVHLCQALFRGMADDLPLLAWLKERIWPLEAAHDERSLAASARLGLAEMLLAGTTSILDMGTVHGHDAVFEAIAESGMRALSGKAMMDTGAGVPKGLRESTVDSLNESLRLADRWHGAGDARIGYAFAPRFILSCTEALLRETAGLARERGMLVHSHAAEHAAERAAVKAALGRDDVAALAAYGIAGPNVVLAHGVQLREAELRSMAKAGTRVVHCPSANLKLASGIADVVAMREAGIEVGLGADGAPCNNRMDPWTELRECALLAKVRRDDAAALPAAEALAIATIGSARVLGLGAHTGSIEPGKQGDLQVVRLDGLHGEPGGDVMARLVYSGTAADVEHVVIGGRLVVHRKKLLTLDVGSVREAARREGERVRKRARLGR